MSIHEDFRTRIQIQRGWWMEERSSVPCKVSADGLLVAFHRKDVEEVLDEHYEYIRQVNGPEKRWYTNTQYDYEIAELDITDDVIYCKPNVLWDHFLTRRM